MKLTEITPAAYRCISAACPKVFTTGQGTLVIVGRLLDPREQSELACGVVGPGEAAVEIPEGLVSNHDVGSESC